MAVGDTQSADHERPLLPETLTAEGILGFANCSTGDKWPTLVLREESASGKLVLNSCRSAVACRKIKTAALKTGPPHQPEINRRSKIESLAMSPGSRDRQARHKPIVGAVVVH